MTRQLAPLIERDQPNIRRFLEHAVRVEHISIDDFEHLEIPAYEVHECLRRLELAGEVHGGTWQPQARADYQALLQPKTDKRLQTVHHSERPREKAARLGIGNLTDTELMALLLRTGSGDEGVLEFADRLLQDHDGLLGLADHDVAELTQAQGIGPAKAAELAAAFELGRRLARAGRRERPVMTTPEEVVLHIHGELAALGHEELWCLALDSRSRLIGEPRVASRGDVDGTEAGPRLFFRHALRAGAVSTIAVHNHPTGCTEPSAADRAVTRRLVAAGNMLDIKLVDHLIIGDHQRYCSLRREHPELFG